MNIEQTKEAVKVMIAFTEGKKIKAKLAFDPDWNACLPISDPSWNWDKYDYRVEDGQ